MPILATSTTSAMSASQARLQRRVAALQGAFAALAAGRMAGLPLLNPRLRVRALGFELHTDAGDAQPAWGLGVLVTPWFMNLVRLPLAPAARVPDVGRSTPRRHGGQEYGFIAAHEPAVGAYEACPLFSPMFEFADAAAAEAVGCETLRLLRPAPMPAPAPTAAARPAAPQALPARRGFLLARRCDEATP